MIRIRAITKSRTRRLPTRWTARLPISMGLVCLLPLLPLPTLAAQEMPVPVDLQFLLFAKILSFDRNQEIKEGGVEIAVGVVYQRKFRPSLNAKEEFMAAVTDAKPVNEFRFRCVPIELSDPTALEQHLEAGEFDMLYVTPMRPAALNAIATQSRARQIITMTGVPEYVSSGMAVGIGTKGKKPRILLNLKAAIDEGADFRSQLLRLAKIVE